MVTSPRHYMLTKWAVDWDAFKMKTANLTAANPMLMMQRRNVNWVIKPKKQVRKTWGVIHVLLIIIEEVLSKVLNIMEKLVEVWGGGGGGWSILIVTIKFSWSFHNVPNYSIDLPHWPPISKIVTYFLLLISAFQSSLISRVHPCITFPERIWSLKSLAIPYNDRFSIFLV